MGGGRNNRASPTSLRGATDRVQVQQDRTHHHRRRSGLRSTTTDNHPQCTIHFLASSIVSSQTIRLGSLYGRPPPANLRVQRHCSNSSPTAHGQSLQCHLRGLREGPREVPARSIRWLPSLLVRKGTRGSLRQLSPCGCLELRAIRS